jgi:hypothetical protein
MKELTEQQKYHIRQVRDHLIKMENDRDKNVTEAYHWLYQFAGTLTDDPYKPWKGIE